MGEFGSVLKIVLKDAGVRPDMVDLILNQAYWKVLRLCVVLLLQSLGEEFVCQLKFLRSVFSLFGFSLVSVLFLVTGDFL